MSLKNLVGEEEKLCKDLEQILQRLIEVNDSICRLTKQESKLRTIYLIGYRNYRNLIGILSAINHRKKFSRILEILGDDAILEDDSEVING
jgi:hypothetical protein